MFKLLKNAQHLDGHSGGQDENPFAKYMPKPQVNYPDVGAENQSFLKKVYVQTWGCQMNVADTERMLSLLGKCNYRPTETVDEADFILLNTCHIREKARHKVVSRLGELRPLKQKNPDLILAISGCVAQAEAKQLAKEVPFVDLIIGPDQIEQLPSLLENVVTRAETAKEQRAFNVHQPLVNAQFNKDEGYSIPVDVIPPYVDETKNEISKYVNIIKGCNNFCTFCVVPYTRGREKSRKLEEVIDEVKYFVDRGIKEIVLLGQNVNSYGLDFLPEQPPTAAQLPEGITLPFADLLYKVAAVDGVDRIRFTTSNPHDFTPSLAQAFADLPKLCNAFHLPVQSGSNKILERMNRQYTREEYLERVSWIRAVRPQIAFSTDIIVGFPGETEEDFEDTMNLVREMKYAFIYAFKYSPRKGTPATRFRDQIPEAEMDRRLQALLALQRQETERQNLAEIGHTREVLVLYRNPKEEHSWYGRTYEGRLVKVGTPRNILGLTVPVKITGANLTALEGHPE
ncbi:MAG: tRNA (N6-isopentenyl adenosine(37)-C2)-methylthiotransferase MiaB [Betaproteobacteria bacterium]|nr:tRNA (N6-isopentenyl adenosine(37)-C2)-methylthiotransferase MiaB [Betaproteobacteria bacterium]